MNNINYIKVEVTRSQAIKMSLGFIENDYILHDKGYVGIAGV